MIWLKILAFWFALALVTAPLIGRWLKRSVRLKAIPALSTRAVSTALSEVHVGGKRIPFWDRIRRENDGCWIWLGPIDDRGYGRTTGEWREFCKQGHCLAVVGVYEHPHRNSKECMECRRAWRRTTYRRRVSARPIPS